MKVTNPQTSEKRLVGPEGNGLNQQNTVHRGNKTGLNEQSPVKLFRTDTNQIGISNNKLSNVRNIGAPENNPPQRKYGGQKVNHKHLSKLMRAILSHIDIDESIERGELVERIFELPRRYCGYFVDPCMRPNEKRKYERRYKRAQPTITRSLNRLENHGLVRLMHHGRYVKRINLTPQGRALADQDRIPNAERR